MSNEHANFLFQSVIDVYLSVMAFIELAADFRKKGSYEPTEPIGTKLEQLFS